MEKLSLPFAFVSRMQRLLGTEYDDFIKAYEGERYQGLRLNPLKVSEGMRAELLAGLFGGECPEAVPWEAMGYYFGEDLKPGRHPLHDAGAYYIQEPSAMSAVSVLDPQPGERILDLCAAPGGKSTQIAGRLMGRGLLVANEYVASRAVILSQNIERMGVRNAVVLNETPEHLASVFPEFFDRILVDAPCSGEGMFRKEEAALLEWSESNVNLCQGRQKQILDSAVRMLRPGGVLVYSTCTFAPKEDEEIVDYILKEYPALTLTESPLARFFSQGRPDFVEETVSPLQKAMRLWPHKLKGEGHFVACFVHSAPREDTDEAENSKPFEDAGGRTGRKKNARGRVSAPSIPDLTEFGLKQEAVRALTADCKPVLFGENLYFLPAKMPSLEALRTERPGLWVGTLKKDRFEPSHSLALALRPCEVERAYELSPDDAAKYLHGESFSCPAELRGWTLLTVCGVSLGFGKASGGVMKNHYPKGLRKKY